MCGGEANVHEDWYIFQTGVHIVVGIPGGVFGMFPRQSLHPDYIRMSVLDEVDEMFSRGFKDQFYDIFQLQPSKAQVGVFSAAMSLRLLRPFKSS